MKKLASLSLFLGLLSSISCFAQNPDPVIFEINGKQIHKSEFMRDFLRSVGKDSTAAPTACTYEKRQALTEYVDLFVNFRTKLEDAYAQGYDTMPTLLSELKGYRTEIASPYLIDSATLERILVEAYERNHYVLHASHILVKLKANPTVADTVAAYKKAMSYYERAVAGEDFTALAIEANEERFRQDMVPPDDPRRRDNGDLGSFTVFDMIYPFENAAYSLQAGEISKPVRTKYGYHVVKLWSRTPSFGKYSLQHIWCAFGDNEAGAESRIREAYKKIQEGNSFARVCSDYSDDQRTAQNGGFMPDMSINQLPPEYVVELAKLQPGQVGEPFRTSFGWHLLMLVKNETLPPFEDMMPYYKQRLARDMRSNEPRSTFIEQCKKRYGFIDYTTTPVEQGKKGKGKNEPTVYMASLQPCVDALNDSVFYKTWHFRGSMVTDKHPLFAIGDKEYGPADLLRYVESRMRNEAECSLEVYLQNRYNEYVNNMVYQYADSRLEEENPEFASLMDEYRTGLMIFAYNDKNVWSRALLDTAGFANFYAKASQTHSLDNEEDAPYFWNERANVTIVTVSDSTLVMPAKALKLLAKATKKQWADGMITDKFIAQKKGEGSISVAHKLVEKDNQTLLQPSQWRKGTYIVPQAKGYLAVRVDELLDPCLKSRTEARGYYVSDYQNYLDAQLIEQLRAKYNVIIHQDVIDEITY